MGNFSKSFKARLLSPRLFVYVLIAVLAAWCMRKYSPVNADGQPLDQPLRPVWHEKESLDEKSPILILFYDQATGTGALQEAFDAADPTDCPTILIAIAPDDDSPSSMKAIFNITTLPCAILADKNNEELARIEGDITPDGIRDLQAKLSSPQP